jgi:hypothetical protein
MNDIDFLRRFGECWQRWVVSDIEATIGLTGINGFCRRRLTGANPANWDYSVGIKCCWGGILLRLLASHGEGLFDVFLYESKCL